MADKAQVAMLLRSVEEWNKWKKEHPDVDIDLTDADLRRADLQGADLGGANLTETNLREAELTKANLDSADFTDAILDGVYGLPKVLHIG